MGAYGAFLCQETYTLQERAVINAYRDDELELVVEEVTMDKQPEFSLDWPHGWHMRSSPTRVLKYIGKSLDESLVFEVESGDTGSVFTQRNSEGKMVSVSGAKYPDYDIINSPAPKRQWWVNVWEDGTGPNAGKFHSSREEADTSAYISTRQRRLACVCITEGDGL